MSRVKKGKLAVNLFQNQSDQIRNNKLITVYCIIPIPLYLSFLDNDVM